MNKDQLIAFETDIAESFNRGEIPYPVHLDSNNEDGIINVFSHIGPNDYILGSWRMHYKALMRGVPPEDLKAAIMRGESMALKFPEYRVYGSAIVGGTLPIALGIAMSIKRRGGSEWVWCWMGDMTYESGLAHECMKYGGNHNLQISWVVENNGVSVLTPTRAVWKERGSQNVWHYDYQSKYPHCGSGKRVQF